MTDEHDIVERLEEAADRVAKRCMGHDTAALVSIPRQPSDVDAICDEAAAEIRRLRAALAKAKLAEELWRTGGLSSNEAMVGISADLRARG